MSHATTRRKQLDLDRIRAAVQIAEKMTSAEIVVAIAPFFLGRVWPAARRAFERLDVAHTRERNGVLVFVVPARRQVIVLPDIGAEARVHGGVWEDVARRIAVAFSQGRGTDGVIEGIESLAGTLHVVFPYYAADVNELPDQPVELR